MESLFAVLKYLVFGFFGLILLLMVLAILFGKRIRTKWEYEADFLDDKGREFGEFEIEMSRIEKEEPDYTQKVKFRMRHPGLRAHASLQVYIDDLLVFEDRIEKDGRHVVMRSAPTRPVESVSSGQVCRVLVGGTELARAELRPD